jgi:histidyl-tRNA synthetase
VRDALGIADDNQWLTIMRAIDKLDRLGPGGVRQLLGEGRKDESGDFTKGAGLKEDDIALVVSAIEQSREAPLDPRLSASEIGQQGRDELDQISKLVAASGYGEDRIKIDPSVVRGLEYYTGVSRLQAALTLLGKLDTRPEFGPVVVTVFDRDRVADYQKMVASLRTAGIRAELYLGNPKNMGNQLKYADRRNAPCVIIQGSDEKARGEVQIKDLKARRRPPPSPPTRNGARAVRRNSPAAKPTLSPRCARCWRAMT